MKKFLLVVIAVLSFSSSQAQELGVRLGDVSGGAVAVDAIFSTGEFNRIHANVSFGSGVGVDLLWDFMYRPLGDVLNWYVGAGPYAFIGSDFQLGAVGEIGLEYHFSEIPIAIGADWRPWFRLVDNTDLGLGSGGLNVRYVF